MGGGRVWGFWGLKFAVLSSWLGPPHLSQGLGIRVRVLVGFLEEGGGGVGVSGKGVGLRS